MKWENLPLLSCSVSWFQDVLMKLRMLNQNLEHSTATCSILVLICFFDICFVATLHNQVEFFHTKDLILNGNFFANPWQYQVCSHIFPSKNIFTRGYLAASSNHTILKEALSMIVDAAKLVEYMFSIMYIVYKVYMDIGGHVELLYDILYI